MRWHQARPALLLLMLAFGRLQGQSVVLATSFWAISAQSAEAIPPETHAFSLEDDSTFLSLTFVSAEVLHA